MPIQTHEDLIVWQKAMSLAEMTYKLSAALPDDERFGLTSQLRRAVVSVPSNIAEGHGSGLRGLYLKHLRIARGSLAEVRTQVLLSERIGFVDRQQTWQTLNLCSEVARLLNALLRSLKNKSPHHTGDSHPIVPLTPNP